MSINPGLPFAMSASVATPEGGTNYTWQWSIKKKSNQQIDVPLDITSDNERKSVSGVGITKALFINFSLGKIFDFAKVPVKFFETHSGETCQIWMWCSIASLCFGCTEKIRK